MPYACSPRSGVQQQGTGGCDPTAVYHSVCWKSSLPACLRLSVAIKHVPDSGSCNADLQISGGEWQKDLLFTVPRDHPEVERLEGRYKK